MVHVARFHDQHFPARHLKRVLGYRQIKVLRLAALEQYIQSQLVHRLDLVHAISFLGVFHLQKPWAFKCNLLRRVLRGKHCRLLVRAIHQQDRARVLDAGEVVEVGSLAELHRRRPFLFTVDDGDAIRDLLEERSAAARKFFFVKFFLRGCRVRQGQYHQHGEGGD